MLFLINNIHRKRCLLNAIFLWGLLLSSSLAFSANKTDNNIESIAEQTTSVTKSSFSLEGKSISRLFLLKKQHENKPNDPAIAASLATEYIQLARKTATEKYYHLARQVIKPWARHPSIPGLTDNVKKEVPQAIRLIRATLSQHDHHYADASEDLYAVIKQQPRNVQAWLTLSTIQLVQGQYPKAKISCSALARINANWLASLCYSQIYSLTGSEKRAYAMQQQLLSQLRQQQTSLRLWVTGLLAETALRLKYYQQAEQYFKAGLKIKENDTYLLRTYSDYLLRQQRPKAVIQLLKTQPENDQLLLRFAIATKQRGESALAKKLESILEQRFAHALAKNNHTHGREEALFLLEFKANHKASQQRALTLAKNNWHNQKEPEDARILLRAKVANQ